MSYTDATTAAAANSTPALPPPPDRTSPGQSSAAVPPRRIGALSGLLWLAVLAGVAYLLWRVQMLEHGHDQVAQNAQTVVQQLHDQVDALSRDVTASQHDAQGLRARLDDAAKVNESLRGQMIGLSERARLTEDAIANLADKRLSSHDSLLLNEAELLLVLGSERYTLFRDPAPALAAYRLADTALAEANNAAFSTIRQSIGAEISALSALQTVNIPAIEAQLDQLRGHLATLAPATNTAQTTESAPASRWAKIFGQFLRVSRDNDTQNLLTRSDPLLARALVDASLRDAQAALLVRDSAQFHSAVAAARAHLAADFNAQSADVAAALGTLDALSKIVIAAPAPEVLGAALRELRNLRATQALHPDPAPAELKAIPNSPASVPTPVSVGQP